MTQLIVNKNARLNPGGHFVTIYKLDTLQHQLTCGK